MSSKETQPPVTKSKVKEKMLESAVAYLLLGEIMID